MFLTFTYHPSTGFLVIVTTFIVFFAFAFLLLFSTHPCVRNEDECFNDIIGADDFDDTAKGLASYPQSLLTIFNVSEGSGSGMPTSLRNRRHP